MTPPSSRRYATLLLVLTTLFACCAQGQMFDVERERVPLSQLQGQWRFHLGDDADGKLGWASPGFDDSNWALLRSDESWAAQGYKNYSGFAWYRFKIMAPARGGSLAICIPRMRTSYQLFANGELIGQSGGLPPNQMDEIAFDQIFLIPGSGEKRGHPISMAIRVWNSAWTAGVAGGPDGAPYVGEISWIRDLKARDDWSRFWSMASGNVLMLMNLTAAFGGFFLFWMRPSDREYLWFGLYELLTGVEHLCSDWIMFYPTNANSNWLLDLMFSAASWLFFLLFVYRILNGRRNWLFWAAIGTEVAMVVATVSAIMDWIDLAQWRVAWAVILVPYFVCILSLLYRRARDRVPDAQMLLGPVALCYTSWFMMVVLLVFLALDQGWVARDFGWFFQLSRWPFPFSFQDVADMIMLLAVLAVLPLRFARSRRDEERLVCRIRCYRLLEDLRVCICLPRVVHQFEACAKGWPPRLKGLSEKVRLRLQPARDGCSKG